METTQKTRAEWIEQKLTILDEGSLSRERYETLCADWTVTAHPDDDLGGYGDKYGEYWGIPYDAMSDEAVAYLENGKTAAECRLAGIEQMLRQQRWWAIEKERKAQVAAAPAAPAVKPKAPRSTRICEWTCVICGEPAEMAASLGMACPEHYDDLSG